MKKSLTGADLFNAVMMQRQLDKRLVLLVECAEDCGVVDPHLNENEVQSFPGYGKKSVLEAAALLEVNGVAEVAPIVDADLDRFTGADLHHPKNVILTEFYDLDADVMFHCPELLTGLAYNFAKQDEYVAYSLVHGITPSELVIKLAASVGAVRYYSVVQGLNLSIRGFPMHVAVEGFEQNSLHSSVLAMVTLRSPGTPPAQFALSDIDAVMASVPDARNLCSGHDVVAALGVLIRHRLNGVNIGNEILASAMRAAVSCACWMRTVVFAAVRDWAGRFGVVAWTCS